jgi:hypothetical protein
MIMACLRKPVQHIVAVSVIHIVFKLGCNVAELVVFIFRPLDGRGSRSVVKRAVFRSVRYDASDVAGDIVGIGVNDPDKKSMS